MTDALPPPPDDPVEGVAAALLAEHEATRHLSAERVAELLRELTRHGRDIALIRQQLHGRPRPTLIDPDRHEGGLVETVESLVDSNAEILDLLSNGGIKVRREWTKSERALAAALLTAALAVLADVVRGWLA